jgi:phospholipase C
MKHPKKPRSLNTDFTRRALLAGLGASVGTAALGCSSSSDDGPGGPAEDPDPFGDGKADLPGGHCEGAGGLSGAELLEGIETIVVLCMENRSFDHYLGSLAMVEGRSVSGLVGDEFNLDSNGNAVSVHHLDSYTPEDPPHDWDSAHAQFDDGANDGFVIAHAGPSEAEVMGYYLRSQLPITYALADQYAVCDRYFASVMGPTWPNRFFLHGASSKGKKDNTPVVLFDNVWSWLDDVEASAKNYFHDIPWCTGAYQKVLGLARISAFFEAAAKGKLPNYCLIDPQFFGSGANDDHPNHDARLGQALIASVYSALAQSPQWKKCLFVLTYDEHGGFYDHVPPPTTDDERPEFQQMGFRVPTIVMGPTVRKGCVVSNRFDHTSIIKTLVTRYGIQSPNVRVDAAKDLSSCIQPAYLNKPRLPVTLPKLEFSYQELMSRQPVTGHHQEMWDAAERGAVPRELDLRSQGLGETAHVLEWGERLGALTVRR